MPAASLGSYEDGTWGWYVGMKKKGFVVFVGEKQGFAVFVWGVRVFRISG